MDEMDYKKEYEQERIRLAKLWDAYSIQERELQKLRDLVSLNETKLNEKDALVKAAKEALEARDKEIRELEIEVRALRVEKATFQPRIDELNKQLRIEKERYAKLFALSEELDEEVKRLKREIEARDEWDKIHLSQFGDVRRALEERAKMINEARAKKEPISPQSK